MESRKTTAVFKVLGFPKCTELTSGMDSLTVLPVCQGDQASSPSIYQEILPQFHWHSVHIYLSQQCGKICDTPIINDHPSLGIYSHR